MNGWNETRNTNSYIFRRLTATVQVQSRGIWFQISVLFRVRLTALRLLHR